MKKTLFTTALAFVLGIGGLTASAQDAVTTVSFDNLSSLRFMVKNVEAEELDGKELKAYLANAADLNDKSYGFLSESGFVPLSSAMTDESIQLPYKNVIQFGYMNSADEFVPRNVSLTVKADPGYYAGYNSDNFFQLDFSRDPFDGVIEVFVMGEPLPASTVSLLVALGAGAALLLYHNRRRRIIGGVEQA